MKLKDGFILREISGSYIIVPTGDEMVDLNGVITLNESGAFLWKQLSKEQTAQSLTAALAAEYDVDEETARTDIADFFAALRGIGALEE